MEYIYSAPSSSSIGSDIFALLALLCICGLVLLVIRYFLPLRTTPAFLLVPVFLALALPTSVVLLVPIDLSSSSGSKGIWLPERARFVAWRITYWLTFALTWAILPLLGEYLDSGYRTPKDRLLYSLRQNGRYQLIVLTCAVTGLTYVLIQNGFHTASVKSLVMALSYCWGLVLAIYLMGHGLVAIPRRLLRNSSVSRRLKRIQAHAPRLHDKLMDSIAELDELEAQVEQLNRRKHNIPIEYEEWIEELAETPAFSLESHTTVNAPPRQSTINLPPVITERYLADLTRSLKRARHKRLRFVDAWDRLIREAADTQAILDASSSQHLDFDRSSPHSSYFSRLTILTPYLRYQLHARVIPFMQISLACICSIASVLIVWSELVKFVAPQLSVISLSIIYHTNTDKVKGINIWGQLMASIWLFYMCFAALASIKDAKVWGNRALVRRRTYAESACWYSGQLAKLTVPLSYNFLTFLPPSLHRETSFYLFMGQFINLTPLGKGFDYFFPIFILVPVCATLFNLYGRIRRVFGFGVLEEDDAENEEEVGLGGYGTGGWREGKLLIERELHGHGSASLNLESSGEPYSVSHATTRPHNPLQASRGPHVPNSNRYASEPSIRVPSARPAYMATPSERLSQARQAYPPRSARAAPNVDDDDNDNSDDEGFFGGFAHRVRNTFEAANTPRWMKEGVKKPKWMGGDGGDGDSSSRRVGNDAGGISRWFGGGGDGRLRI
ncbi:MAG: hypothetical protein M1834_009622 [Cirrosporium novae-zelandiae]|nr:MAG: hypothetical protein M1834_009622 [Cirrosporium novae-zelandiae]